MFRFFKRLLILIVLVAVVAVIAMMILPKRYEVESVVDIKASQTKVFTHARQLAQWNVLAMAGDLPLDKIDMGQIADLLKQIPKDQMPVNIPGVSMDSMASGGANILKGGVEKMKMKVSIADEDAPNKLSYHVTGGPMDGVHAEVVLSKADENSTRVTVRQSQTFEGFTGGIKAFLTKEASLKLNEANLANLKKLCEPI